MYRLAGTACDAWVCLVEVDVAGGRRQRVSTDIKIGHGCGAPASGVEREPTAETERVEHALPLGDGLHPSTVLSLIEKESSLLTSQDFGLEVNSGFQKKHRPSQVWAVKNFTFSESAGCREILDIPAQAKDDSLWCENLRHLWD